MARLGTLVRLVGFGIAFIIVVGIALVVLDADEQAEAVDAWLDVARFFVDPFAGMFDLERGKENEEIALNWGIGAVVYVVVAAVIGRLLTRVRR